MPPAFSADELLAIYVGSLERGSGCAWTNTAQALTEYLTLAQRLAQLARRAGDVHAAEELTQRAREAESHLWRLRRDRFAS